MALRVWLIGLALASPAAAQDVSSRWMDRVLQELAVERGPLERQTEVDLSGGLLAYHDDNIFLSEDDEESDTILVPFATARVLYTEEHLELLGDLMADYKAYSDEDDESDAEARFLGRARYVGSNSDIGLLVMARLESDPTDAVFADRVERRVFDVQPRVGVDVTPVLTLEGNFLWQVVRFDEDALADLRDNNTWRGAAAAIYKTEGLFDYVVEAGVIGVEYRNDVAPPDADGYFARGGVRGSPAPDWDVQALVGYLHAESDDLDTGVEVEDDDTVDASISIRWRAQERWSFTGTYTRTMTFFGGADPWAIVNRLYLLAEHDVNERWRLGGRVVYDVLVGALDTERTYVSVGGDVTFKVVENVLLEGGATFRTGETEPIAGPSSEYDNLLLFVGIAATY